MPLSLKWTIQLWHGLILGVVLAALGAGFYHHEKTRRIADVDQLLDDKLNPLLGLATNRSAGGPRNGTGGPGGLDDDLPEGSRIGPPPHLRAEGADVIEDNAGVPGWTRRDQALSPDLLREVIAGPDRVFEKLHVAQGYYAKVVSKRDGAAIFTSSNFPAIEVPQGRFHGYHQRTRDGRYRELLQSNPHFFLLVGFDLAGLRADLGRLKLEILGTTLAIFAAGLLVGHLLVSRSLRPLRGIEETSAAIARGRLSSRIPAPRAGRSRELDELAGHLNETFAQLESLFQRQLRFTADASHELRTPLTALLAQLQFGLKKLRSPEEYHRVLEIAARSGERIRRITEQLLELARYDSGRVKLDWQAIPLEVLLGCLAEELDPYVKEKGGRLVVDVGPGEITCDPFRLEQVLTNLANNALQHNERPVTITLRARVEAAGGACIEVSDDGKGIRPENLGHVFDRFFQEDAARAKEGRKDNSGLGLAICQAIIEAHGGTITVRSEPDRETVFTLHLPIPAEKNDEGAGPSRYK